MSASSRSQEKVTETVGQEHTLKILVCNREFLEELKREIIVLEIDFVSVVAYATDCSLHTEGGEIGTNISMPSKKDTSFSSYKKYSSEGKVYHSRFGSYRLQVNTFGKLLPAGQNLEDL